MLSDQLVRGPELRAQTFYETSTPQPEIDGLCVRPTKLALSPSEVITMLQAQGSYLTRSHPSFPSLE